MTQFFIAMKYLLFPMEGANRPVLVEACLLWIHTAFTAFLYICAFRNFIKLIIQFQLRKIYRNVYLLEMLS